MGGSRGLHGARAPSSSGYARWMNPADGRAATPVPTGRTEPCSRAAGVPALAASWILRAAALVASVCRNSSADHRRSRCSPETRADPVKVVALDWLVSACAGVLPLRSSGLVALRDHRRARAVAGARDPPSPVRRIEPRGCDIVVILAAMAPTGSGRHHPQHGHLGGDGDRRSGERLRGWFAPHTRAASGAPARAGVRGDGQAGRVDLAMPRGQKPRAYRCSLPAAGPPPARFSWRPAAMSLVVARCFAAGRIGSSVPSL